MKLLAMTVTVCLLAFPALSATELETSTAKETPSKAGDATETPVTNVDAPSAAAGEKAEPVKTETPKVESKKKHKKKDKAEEKAEAPAPEDKQETVTLGDNRFLIFSGSPGEYEYVYSVDLIQLENGVPHFEPLFFEEYNDNDNSVKLAHGMAFGAVSYHFDKNTNTLHYTSKDAEDKISFEYEYKLDKDMFNLQQVTSQEKDAEPKILFKADAKKK